MRNKRIIQMINEASGQAGKRDREQRLDVETLFVILAVLFFMALAAKADRSLTFNDRVRAQEAIERVYYEHRIWPKENPGPKPPFEQMISRAQIEAKVEDYLKKSAALDKLWQRPIQPEQLQAEMDRMAKQTKDPDTLRELFAALGNDPNLIAECLARPVLADRLIRNWYANDERFHRDSREKAERAMKDLIYLKFANYPEGEYGRCMYCLEGQDRVVDRMGDVDIGTGFPVIPIDPVHYSRIKSRLRQGDLSLSRIETPEAIVVESIANPNGRCYDAEFRIFRKIEFRRWWDSVQADIFSLCSMPLASPTTFIIPAITSARSGSSIGTWESSSLNAAPDLRAWHSAVWTGSEMIIWGGEKSRNYSEYFNTGGRYNPATDAWTAMALGPECPSARTGHTAIWTGTEMIIWGGMEEDVWDYTSTGGRYRPDSDTWQALPTGPLSPQARGGHTAVWTGREMIIWGGHYRDSYWNFYYLNSGGRFDPEANSWSATSTGGECPSGRTGHTCVWTGREMIVWGGQEADYHPLASGARYRPQEDAWTTITPRRRCPSARYGHTAVWTGKVMIVWGGGYWDIYSDRTRYFYTGGIYDPLSDLWIPTATGRNCPSERESHSAVWTGREMIIWAGHALDEGTGAGGRYDPLSDSWKVTSLGPNCPCPRSGHTAVWTGTEMIVWGGSLREAKEPAIVGGRYDPATNSWVAMAPSGGSGPSGCGWHSALWTGMEMIVWGGMDGALDHNSGGLYSLALDNWSAMSTGLNCPQGRYHHKAVWTGTEMIVWGGLAHDSTTFWLKTGGRYRPADNSWSPTSVDGACPTQRSSFTAVWTGTEMILWGGYDGSQFVSSGGAYDPQSDRWHSTTIAGSCPTPRARHTAVWTGEEMIVWGGYNGTMDFIDTGGRYRPRDDVWTPTSTGRYNPSGRSLHTSIWTGAEMVVWGGWDWWDCLNGGARYSPSNDAWNGLGGRGPSERCLHSAVWSGEEMILWGGEGYWYEPLNSGGIYNPASHSWAPTPQEGYCPSGRRGHGAVWAGTSMIIWGGLKPIENWGLASGGIYRPGSRHDRPVTAP